MITVQLCMPFSNITMLLHYQLHEQTPNLMSPQLLTVVNVTVYSCHITVMVENLHLVKPFSCQWHCTAIRQTLVHIPSISHDKSSLIIIIQKNQSPLNDVCNFEKSFRHIHMQVQNCWVVKFVGQLQTHQLQLLQAQHDWVTEVIQWWFKETSEQRWIWSMSHQWLISVFNCRCFI